MRRFIPYAVRHEQAWNNSEPETLLSVPPLFIDGMSHERMNPDARCCGRMERCWLCDVGSIHKQGVYGGYVKQCDVCLESF
jgi:hypothetical protein